MKQKFYIAPVPIACANRRGTFVCYAECAKSKVQKMVNLFNAADEGAQLKVDTLYLVSGPVEMKLDMKGTEKGMKFIIPAGCACGRCEDKTEIKCESQKEVIATVAQYNGAFHVEATGMNVVVYGKVRRLAGAKVERMFKKAEDSLKTDFKTAQKIISLSCGVI